MTATLTTAKKVSIEALKTAAAKRKAAKQEAAAKAGVEAMEAKIEGDHLRANGDAPFTAPAKKRPTPRKPKTEAQLAMEPVATPIAEVSAVQSPPAATERTEEELILALANLAEAKGMNVADVVMSPNDLLTEAGLPVTVTHAIAHRAHALLRTRINDMLARCNPAPAEPATTREPTEENDMATSTATKTPKTKAAPKPESNGRVGRTKKDGLRSAQERILKALARTSPMTRKLISQKAPCDLANCTELVGSADDDKRKANDIKHFPSLISLGLVRIRIDEEQGSMVEITAAGKKAAEKIG